MKPRKPIRKVSVRRAKLNREYTNLKRAFLKSHPECAVFKAMRSEDIHHLRGRAGSLLLDTSLWLAVSRRGHDWIHANPEAARRRGLLCEKGLWNTPVWP
jgi:hypothetical protein